MLEKIGLPAKPSLRGNVWVVDASHCQGCSAQFSFINRKHHCRRCGGIFCNSCTQQRMHLRGQGDSPVRICDPCKKLEEAARFEMRYGHKSRALKGSSKLPSNSENDVLRQILGTDVSESSSSGLKTDTDTVSTNRKVNSSVSFPNMVTAAANDKEGEVEGALESACTPAELRQQAVEHKSKYKVLKGEGKSEEALKAFKRGKELERQADALEISIRRNRKKVSVSSIITEMENQDGPKESKRKSKPSRESVKKEDFGAELREMGWSDDEDKKAVTVSLEGELSSLIGEVIHKSTNSIDKSGVIALKRKALGLKREGKLAEAKEELKKAKILEKQLEEKELLGGDEESDDEILAIINSMDDDKDDDLLVKYEQNQHLDFGQDLGGLDYHLDADGEFQVTDEDMVDPEIAAALTSFGWTEDSSQPQSIQSQVPPVDRESLLAEIQSLKREALNQKRAGNTTEAMTQLKKAKLLERELESLGSETTDTVFKSDNVGTKKDTSLKLVPKSRITIQKELLAVKKKALALRREGRSDEAEEELKRGKILEDQLEEMDNSTKVASSQVNKNRVSAKRQPDVYTSPLIDEGEVDVTDQDMHDPSYLAVLTNLGWDGEDNIPAEALETQAAPTIPVKASRRSKSEIQRELLGLKRKALALRREGKIDEADEILNAAKGLETQISDMEAPKVKVVEPVLVSGVDDFTEKDMHDPDILSALKSFVEDEEESKPVGSAGPSVAAKSKGEIQRELLGLKRKALALRRNGEIDEADELLKNAKVLEAQMAELEAPKKDLLLDASTAVEALEPSGTSDFNLESLAGFGGKESSRSNSSSLGDSGTVPNKSHFTVENDSLLGQIFPSGESSIFGTQSVPSAKTVDILTGDYYASSPMPSVKQEGNRDLGDGGSPLIDPPLKSKSMSNTREGPSSNDPSRITENTEVENDVQPDRNKADVVRQEILAHKRKALALKREGKISEARDELRQAKLLEKNLEEVTLPEKKSPDIEVMPVSHITPEQKINNASSSATKTALSGRDRFKLQQQSLSHKRQAMKLRREGRLQEAEAESELAKALEAQLDDFVAKQEPADGVVVEDFLDPQLVSALKAIGLDNVNIPLEKSETIKPNANVVSRNVEKQETLKSSTDEERTQLEERIKAEKVKAVSLKRMGKQAEAKDALRRAKLYEKKLNALT